MLHHPRARIEVLVNPVPETHQPERIVLVLCPVDEFGNAIHGSDLAQHLQAGLVGAAMGRAPKTGDTGGNTGKRVGPRRRGQPHRRGRGVLLVVRMQREDPVHRAAQDRVDLVIFSRDRKAHAQEIRGIIDVIPGIHERLADCVFIGHRSDGRHLGDQADRGDFALPGVVDVGRVVIEGGKRPHDAHHDRHRMGVAAESPEQKVHLFVDHRVICHPAFEILKFVRRRQFAVKQKIANLQKMRFLGQLVDRIAAMQQLALFAVDEGDRGIAGRRRSEARIIGKDIGLPIKLADVDHVRAAGRRQDRQVDFLSVEGQFG